MKIMIIDDEIIALKTLENKIRKVLNVSQIFKVSEWEEILPTIRTEKPNIIFLDINLGTKSGLEIAEIINNEFPCMKIVFVTAYAEYAVKAFELNAVDYLLKPVTNKRLKIFMDKITDKEIGNFFGIDVRRKKINIKVLDQVSIKDDSNKEIVFRTKKATELLLLLWHFKNQGLKRDEIIEYLWPESNLDQGVTLLHTTIYQLRATFAHIEYVNPITFTNQLYKLSVDVNSDYDILEDELKKDITEQRVIDILNIYRNKYFEKERYCWSVYFSNQLDKLVSLYFAKIIKEELANKIIIDKIVHKTYEENSFEEEWVSTIIKYYYKTGQKHKMACFYEKIKKMWEMDLDLDLEIESELVEYINQ